MDSGTGVSRWMGRSVRGWNDHVEFIELECLSCGQIDTWEFWDKVGVARYSGNIGRLLGVHATAKPKCPHCGSMKGKVYDDLDDPDWD